MAERVVLLSLPQVRRRDVTPGALSCLDRLCAKGCVATLAPPFPGLSATTFASLVTGEEPSTHGMVSSAYYDRSHGRIVGPYLSDKHVHGSKIWDRHVLKDGKTLLWFAPNTEGADVDIWGGIDHEGRLRTRPIELGEELERRFGPFPRPLGGPSSAAPRFETTAWAVKTGNYLIETEQPRLVVARVPYLGHVARRFGPDSREAGRAIRELDRLLGPALASWAREATLVAVTESIATPVSEPVDVNRTLRELDALELEPPGGSDGRDVDLSASDAFGLPEHQICHVYVKNRARIAELAAAFAGEHSDGIAKVIQGTQLERLGLGHARTGDLVLVADPDRWFRGDWWRNPEEAPRGQRFASGLDPTSLRLVSDPARVQGSIGAPLVCADDVGVVVSSAAGLPRSMRVVDLKATLWRVLNAG